MFCVLEMEQTRVSLRGVRLDTDSPFLGGLGKPLGAPLHLGPSDQDLGQAGVGQVRPLHGGGWELGRGAASEPSSAFPAWLQTGIIPEPEQGALACVGGFVSQPHPGGQGGLPPLRMWATPGLFWGLESVGRAAPPCCVCWSPREELCKYLCRARLGWEQSLTVALGSGEGGRGQQEGQPGGVRQGEPQPLLCPEVASRKVGLQRAQDGPFTVKHRAKGAWKAPLWDLLAWVESEPFSL